VSKWRRLQERVPERQAKPGWAKDTTPESWCCVDCGVDTAPGNLGRAEMELEMAAYGGVQFTIGWNSEVYTVHRHVWEKTGLADWGGVLVLAVSRNGLAAG
jgi:hypothetical protein